ATDGGNADFAGAKICPACFQAFLTTTASADFSQTLIREISPGKVLKLSARAAKLSATAPALLYLPHPWGRT
ncbi:MAG: hypothetical protein M8364_12420, partial [Methylobacter sp.]|uniref:hypothetical protein n=1 Tax=Methylobacter sp. TaxID=2051955 RepID=UPI0025834313